MTFPSVTNEPAIVPMREARKSWRTSAWPSGVLDLVGLEHALHRRAQLLDRAVDHRVGADLDALALGDRARVADRAHVEGEDHGVGGGREHHVGLVDAADAAVDDVDRDLVLRQLRDLVLDRLERAGDVGLERPG